MEVDLSRPPVLPKGAKFLKPLEVARYLRVDRDRLTRMAWRGEIPGAVLTPGRRWLIPRAWVDQVVAEGFTPRAEQ